MTSKGKVKGQMHVALIFPARQRCLIGGWGPLTLGRLEPAIQRLEKGHRIHFLLLFGLQVNQLWSVSNWPTTMKTIVFPALPWWGKKCKQVLV